MELPDQLTTESVLAAMADYDGGTVAHEFIESTKFDLLHEGRRYPPKAIVALATLRETGELPVPGDFSGGVGSKCFRLLRDAGFRTVPKPNLIPFSAGSNYTRSKIAEYLGTTEDTTKGDWATGYHFHQDTEAGIPGWWFVFAAVGSESRTGHDYTNRWISDTEFEWEGKTNSKIGQSQIDKLLSGDYPVLLFCRSDDRAPFVYHGVATPLHVEETIPVRVVWAIDADPGNIPSLSDKESESSDSDYTPEEGDRRELVLREIRARRGQQAFRDSLLESFGGRCAISGCDIVSVLEAAHIRPYRGINDHHPSNGLLLRTDLHTLFDLNLLAIEPETLVIHLHESARRDPYGQYHMQPLATEASLSYEALLQRWHQFQAAHPG